MKSGCQRVRRPLFFVAYWPSRFPPQGEKMIDGLLRKWIFSGELPEKFHKKTLLFGMGFDGFWGKGGFITNEGEWHKFHELVPVLGWDEIVLVLGWDEWLMRLPAEGEGWSMGCSASGYFRVNFPKISTKKHSISWIWVAHSPALARRGLFLKLTG